MKGKIEGRWRNDSNPNYYPFGQGITTVSIVRGQENILAGGGSPGVVSALKFTTEGDERLCEMLSAAIENCEPWGEYANRHRGDAPIAFGVSGNRMFAGGGVVRRARNAGPATIEIRLTATRSGERAAFFDSSLERRVRGIVTENRMEAGFREAEWSAMHILVHEAAYMTMVLGGDVSVKAVGRVAEEVYGAPGFAAVRALSNLGSKAEPAIESLVKVVAKRMMGTDESRAASEALAKLGTSAVRPLVEMIVRRDSQNRFVAVRTLRRMGKNCRAATSALERLLEDGRVGSDVRRMLEKMGGLPERKPVRGKVRKIED